MKREEAALLRHFMILPLHDEDNVKSRCTRLSDGKQEVDPIMLGDHFQRCECGEVFAKYFWGRLQNRYLRC